MNSLTYLMLLFLVACGKTSSPWDEEFEQRLFLKNAGYYRAPFTRINPKVRSGILGRASFYINDIQFYAKVNLQTKWKGVSFLQMVHEKRDCPTSKDDLNHDGYVDAEELMAVVGKVLIPLDLDLSSQNGKLSMMPFTNSKGKYLYSQAGSTSEMIKDLHKRDLNPLDFLGKLKRDDDLILSDMAVIIYGSPDKIILPSTVKGLANYPVNLSLPIACGLISETADVFP